MYELDQELRKLGFKGKTDKQAQEDKLENMKAKIQICKLKQEEAQDETKFL